MHIKIVGFKIHLEADLIFENGKMTLLRATSGAGKSTILQAIFWAMYGNMRGIYNSARITKSLSVTLSLPGMTIVRKKNPELLAVSVNEGESGKVYEDAIAQSIIDNTYGHRDLWRACSYIEQKNRCSLLSGTAAERMELLNALSFTGENPKDFIGKISSKLKEMTNEFETKQAIFVNELNSYTKMLEERTIQFSYTEDDILKIGTVLTRLESELKEKHEQLLGQERLSGTLTYLKGTGLEIRGKIDKLKSFLNIKRTPDIHKVSKISEYPQLITFNEPEIVVPEKLKVVTDKSVMNLSEKEVISYSLYSSEKTKYSSEISKLLQEISRKDRLETEILLVDGEIEKIGQEVLKVDERYKLFSRMVKEEEIWNVKKLETERRKYEDEAKAIGLGYDENVIRAAITNLTEQLKNYNLFESQLDNYNRLLSLEKKIEEMNKFKSDSLSSLENLSKEKMFLIADMKKGLELLSCPKCKAPIRYQNGSLSLGERDPVSKDEILKAEKEYSALLQQIQNCRELIKHEENFDFINKSLNRAAMQDYIANSRNKITSLSQLITRISKIQFIEPVKEDSEFLLGVLKYQTLIKRQKEIENKREALLKDIQTLNSEECQIRLNFLKQNVEELENKYREEQNRVIKNQEEVKKYQNIESERLKWVAKFDKDIRDREERRRRIEKENADKIARYEDEVRRIERELKQKEEEMKKEREEFKRAENELNSLVAREEDNIEEMKKIILNGNIKQEYEEVNKKISELKKQEEDAKYTVKCLAMGKELEKKRDILMALQNDVEILTSLKIKAVAVECKQLEDTVNNINTVLENTLQIFFNDPISLTLQLYKKVKDNVKPGLNIEICYKGCKYDNISYLSGGEGDRISLGLLLALNSVSNSNILLLDEAVASLEGDLKENCIAAIKSIPNKTVIVVDHDDAMEGFYDCIIDI